MAPYAECSLKVLELWGGLGLFLKTVYILEQEMAF